jgi:hypothetical protein
MVVVLGTTSTVVVVIVMTGIPGEDIVEEAVVSVGNDIIGVGNPVSTGLIDAGLLQVATQYARPASIL